MVMGEMSAFLPLFIFFPLSQRLVSPGFSVMIFDLQHQGMCLQKSLGIYDKMNGEVQIEYIAQALGTPNIKMKHAILRFGEASPASPVVPAAQRPRLGGCVPYLAQARAYVFFHLAKRHYFAQPTYTGKISEWNLIPTRL
jgi:hypothetical protein